MLPGQRPAKRKFAEREETHKAEEISQPGDLHLYLLTTGPAKQVWSMATIADSKLVELMPVFDTQQQALGMLESLQDKSCLAATITLSRLAGFAEDRDLLFMLNPKAAVRGDQVYLREGPNWLLTIDQLNSLLTMADDKRIK